MRILQTLFGPLALGTALLLLPTPSLALEKDCLPTTPRADLFMGNARPRVERQLAAKGLRLGDPVFLRIFKMSKEMEAWVRKGDAFQLFKTYPICNYSGFVGPKLKEGDWQSPEGFYEVSGGRLNPDSRFHLSFDIGYPNELDRLNKRTGSAIMVHGKCISQGCFAMGNLQIEEIYLLAYQAFLHGQAHVGVHVFPFRMTKENMDKYKDSPWISFWKNLQEGYDAFERDRKVPVIKAAKDKYVVVEQPQQQVVMIDERIDIRDKLPNNF